MKISRILVPIDFSESAEHAVKAAGMLVDYFGSTVDLMHAVPMMKYFHDSMDPLGVPFSIEKDLYPHSLEQAKNNLEGLAKAHIKKEHIGSTITQIERKPSEGIYTVANSGRYDLVVMATHAADDSMHLLGGTTEKVIRHSKVPVLTIPKEKSLDKLTRLVVPIDFSEHSMQALRAAFELAKEFEATIVLLNVIELYSAGSDMMPYVPVNIDEQGVYENMMVRLSEYVDEQVPEFQLRQSGVVFTDELVSTKHPELKVDLETVVLKGVSAHHEIVDYVDEHGDLLVMSTHGRTGLARILIGSTTEQVARHSKKPMLTIRSLS
ncbi:universal stress protein [Balneolaceae bacterium]|nr:universal stress protein [Balneolaceae bacterium]